HSRVGGSQCIGFDSLLDCDALLRYVGRERRDCATLASAVENSAHDRARCDSMPNRAANHLLHADKRIGWPGAGPIAAECQRRAALFEAAPAVGRRLVLGIEVGSDVAATERGLGADHNPELGEARQILRRGEFGVVPPQKGGGSPPRAWS